MYKFAGSARHIDCTRQMPDVIMIISSESHSVEVGISPILQMRKPKPHSLLVTEPGWELRLSGQGVGAHPLLQEAFLHLVQLILTPHCSKYCSGLLAPAIRFLRMAALTSQQQRHPVLSPK